MAHEKPGVRILKEILKDILIEDRRFFLIIASYALIIALLNLALPISIQTLISTVINTALIQPIMIISIFLVFLLSFSAILALLQKYLLELYNRHSFARLSSKLLLSSVYSDYEQFNRYNTSDLSSRYFEIFNIQKGSSILIVDGSLTLLQIIVGVILSSFYHPYFLMLNLIMVFVILVTWYLFSNRAIYLAITRSESKFAVFAWVDDMFRMNIFFKSKVNKIFALQKAHGLIGKYILARKKYWRIYFAQFLILTILYVVITISLFTIGSTLVVEGQLSLGQLVAAEIIFTGSLVGVVKLSSYFDVYYNLIASSYELNQAYEINQEHNPGLIERIDESKLEHISVLKFEEVKYVDDFNVTYNYNFTVANRSNNLFLFKNSHIKYVFFELVQDLIHPVQGRIEFCGISHKMIEAQYLRSQIMIIDNSDVLGCSIREFLLILDKQNSLVNLDKVLKLTGLDEVFHKLPNGIDTDLINNEYPLHSSQMVLLKIARALIYQPKLIIMTSVFFELDEEIRNKIMDYIFQTTSITLISAFEASSLNYDNYDQVLEFN